MSRPTGGFDPIGSVRRWSAGRADRRLLLAALLAGAASAAAMALLPASIVEDLLGRIVPSTSRRSPVRDLLLDQHRLLFAGLGASAVAAVLLAPAAFRTLERFLGWLVALDRRVFLGVVILLVIVSRLAVVDRMPPIVPNEDPGHYLQLANTLLDEGRYIEYASYEGEPDGYRAWRAPGFPAALSVVLALTGRAVWSIVVLNTIWMIVLVLAIYGLVRGLGTEPQARLATLACAFYPTFLTASLNGLNELQFAALLVLSTFLLFGYRGDRIGALLGGIVLGLAALTRGNALLMLPALLVAYAVYQRRRGAGDRRPGRAIGARVALVALGFLVAVGPWVVRNRIVLDDWVPIATSGGVDLWVGHHPGGRGLVRSGEYPLFPEGLTEAEMADYGTRQALRYWLDEPLANLKLGVGILVTILKVDSGALPVIYPDGSPRGGGGRVHAALLVGLFNLLYYGVWLMVALWAVGRLAGRWPAADGAGILLVVGLLYLLTFVPFFGWQRFKIPLLPFLVAVAAMVVATLARPVEAAAQKPA